MSASVAQSVDLSLWHSLQAFGIFRLSVRSGKTKWKVWLATFTSAIVCAIFGMWQATHSLPGLPAGWCVWSSIVAACGPFCVFGPWHVRHTPLPGFRNMASFSEPCGSWQLKQVTPRAYIRLGYEVVALHAVLVRGAVREMGECRLAELVILELPEVVEVKPT